MRRTDTGIPALSICITVRNSESTFEATLKSVRERAPQAEIVVVDTMSSDSTPEIAKKYADVYQEYRGPKGDWDKDLPWIDDMAAARQKTFELASGRWRMWVDSDDRLAGPAEAEKLLKLNARWKPMSLNADHGPDEGSLEDLLLNLEKDHPEADVVYAPYLYMRDKDDTAVIWQERERIIKWSTPARWRWAEAAHEILVPVPGYKPKYRIEFAHLLFVHERKFDQAALDYSTARHFAVLSKQYDAGDKTTRRCLYLAAYAKTLCPAREREFIDAAHLASTTMTDRYRSMIALGTMFARQGLFLDAREAFAAATHMRGDLPDAWIHGAESWIAAEDSVLAADWLEKGILAGAGQMDSYIGARHLAIRYPTLLALEYQKIAVMLRKAGDQERALQYLAKAVEALDVVLGSSAIGEDRREAYVRRARMHNEFLAQKNAISLKNLSDYLVNNDEPAKAVAVLAQAPWNLQDHPILIEAQKKLEPVVRHMSDPKAYQDFYEKDLETGYVHSPESWLDPEKGGLGRVRWVANWINAYAPNCTVMDLGCFDGIVGIPLLLLCPGIKYFGLDIYQKSVDKFRERLKARGLDNRAEIHRIDSISEFKKIRKEPVDVAIWFEVIEHVPDVVGELKRILSHVRPGGQLFVTTPWGSFDAGHPPEKNDHGTPRDSRGHVRAMTARDVVTVFEAAGVEVEDLHKLHVDMATLGDGLHVQGSLRPARQDVKPAVFAVPGALWDWNSRTVHSQGMGASEKSIVQVSEALALDYRKVEVYGPVPNADVYKGVRYWPKEQLRHLAEGKIVVSRRPDYAKYLDGVTRKKLQKILWLQDAIYPELNAEMAEDYEKIVVVSNWHKEAMNELHGVPLDKMEVIYNPVDGRMFRGPNKPARKTDRFIYCSSPDRGLIPLLKLWPRILEALPEANLQIFYGWRGCQKLGGAANAEWTKRYEAARRAFETLRYQKGVEVLDMVDPTTLSIAMMSAGVWAYPVVDFHETCCTAALEARAAGCVPVAPPFAALTETARCKQSFITPMPDQKGWEDVFVESCLFASKVSEADRMTMSAETINQHSIEVSVAKWRALLE